MHMHSYHSTEGRQRVLVDAVQPLFYSRTEEFLVDSLKVNTESQQPSGLNKNAMESNAALIVATTDVKRSTIEMLSQR